LGALFAVALACTPDIPSQAPPAQVVALFDPAAEVPVAPTPNSLAYDGAQLLLAPPDLPDQTEADRLLNRYLRTLDGFPAEASATSAFSGALDPASVTPAAVRVLDLTNPAQVALVPTAAQLEKCQQACSADPSPATCAAACPAKLAVAVQYDAVKKKVKVTAPFERDRTYAIALLGGEKGLAGANAEAVVGSPAFVFLRARKPLVTCKDLSSPDCRAVTALMRADDPEKERSQAVALEKARLELKPALDYLETQFVPRERLAAAWSFRTVRQGLATFDPKGEVIPFPNDLLMLNGKVNLPADPKDNLTAQELKASLNKLDGFSTSASLLTESGDAVGAADLRLDATTLKAEQFRLVNLDAPPEAVSLTPTCRACGTAAVAPGTEPDQVALKPDKPLRSHTRYAFFWLKGARTLDGRAVNANVIFALTRLPLPLFANGKSTTDAVDDLTAALLEPLREKLQPAFAAADTLGIAREDILVASTFTTQTTSASLPGLAAKPGGAWALPTGITGGPTNLVAVDFSQLALLENLCAGCDLHSAILWAKEGEFTSADALDPAGTEVDLNQASKPVISTEGPFTDATLATPRVEQRRFFLAVPKGAKSATGRIPVVIFGHGLGESRRDAILIANTIALAGYATLAIDAPFHGLRSYCQGDTDCRAGVTCTNHRCPDLLADPNDGYKVRNLADFGADPLGTPAISSSQFVSSTNLFASRDHFRQQVIDVAQLIRVLNDTTNGIGAIDVNDPATAAVTETLEPAHPRYIGQSLGGIMGTLISAGIPEITASTLNVPGASMTDVILTSPSFHSNKVALDNYLTLQGKTPGTQAYEQFMDLARWALDPADPQSYGRHLIAEPLVASWPRKRIFVSWIQGDGTIPNPTTQLLLNSIETGPAPANFQVKKYAGGDHSFLLGVYSPTSSGLAIEAQTDAVDWVTQ
jgi:hypothetical protein